LLVAVAAPARAQVVRTPAPPEIDLRGFVETVDRIASEVEHTGPDSRRLTSVLARIPSRLRVKAGDQHFDVPFEPLAQMVAGAKPGPSTWVERRPAIHRQLLVIKSEAAALLDDSTIPTTVDARPALAAILARKEFASAAPADWTARLRARIGEWLLALWDRVGGNRVDPHRAARVLVWVSTLSAIAGLLIWLHRNARWRIARAQEPSTGEAPTPATGWARRALTAMKAGRASEAVRFAYRAAIARLAELGVWRVDEARTAREYVTLLPGTTARDGAFRDIAGQFERVVYGNRAATAADLERLVDHLETLGCVRPNERAI
jgi:Domain of unknown function (DUF4129)